MAGTMFACRSMTSNPSRLGSKRSMMTIVGGPRGVAITAIQTHNQSMALELAVLTPEKAIVAYPLASLGRRITAHILDIILIVALMFGLFMGISTGIGLLGIDPGFLLGIFLVFTFLVPLGYFVLFEGLWNGTTPGKRAQNLRVRMADGTPVTFGAALGRNLLRPADMLPGVYFVGIIAMFLNPKAQRLGDLVADTVVVAERKGLPLYHPAPHAAGVHAYESAVGDLRGMTSEEYLALRRLADRFPELPQKIQFEMIDEVWKPISDRRKIPSYGNIHPLLLIEATVMKYGRQKGLL
ncbi:RDD family protein [bacterium]|nr:MAG: RDD family protein [bacterium]